MATQEDAFPAAQDRMKLGEALPLDKSLVSANGRFSLTMQGDGNMVLYMRQGNDWKPLWASDTYGRRDIAKARLEKDGRLYLVDKNGNNQSGGRTSKNVNGKTAYGEVVADPVNLELVVQDDGNVTILSNGKPTWDTNTRQPKEQVPASSGNKMDSSQFLSVDKYLESSNKGFRFIMQGDGNLVLYKIEGPDKSRATWASGSSRADRLVLEDDGNLRVLGGRGDERWASGSRVKDGTLTLRDDGNAVITATDGSIIWQTDTAERPVSSFLAVGESCRPNDSLISANKKFRLTYQPDENMVMYREDGSVAWNPELRQLIAEAGRMTMNQDGILELKNKDGNVRWHSDYDDKAPGNKGVRLQLRDDGNLVILNAADEVVWSPTMDIMAPKPCTKLRARQWVGVGHEVTSPNGDYYAVITPDGNFKLFHRPSGTVAWEPTDIKQPAAKLVMQGDGNLVLYSSSNEPLWSTGTRGANNTFFIEDNGNAKVPLGWPRGWELGIKSPALNGSVDRLGAGQAMLSNQKLVSKNGKFELKFDIKPISTASGNQITEAYVAISDLQENTAKYYMLAERPDGRSAQRLVLNAEGWLEIFESGGTVAWRSRDLEREQREAEQRRYRRRGSDDDDDYRRGGSRKETRYESYELVFQDDGNLVLNGRRDLFQESPEYARSFYDRYRYQDRGDYRDQEREERESYRRGGGYEDARKRFDEMQKKREEAQAEKERKMTEEMDKVRYRNDAIWAIADKNNYPSASFPGRNRLNKGEKLMRGQELSLPSGGYKLKLQDDCNLVLYNADMVPLWASNSQGQIYGRDTSQYLMLQADGNLVYTWKGIGTITQTDRNGTRSWEEPFENVKWASGTSGTSDPMYLELEPEGGDMVIKIGGANKWNAKAQNWEAPPTSRQIMDAWRIINRS